MSCSQNRQIPRTKWSTQSTYFQEEVGVVTQMNICFHIDEYTMIIKWKKIISFHLAKKRDIDDLALKTTLDNHKLAMSTLKSDH